MPNINKNIIMQAGAAVANATNKAAGLSASTPEPGSIISAIQLVNGGRTIGPAALAHFTESVRNKLLSLLVTMEPIQDFNGYGHPWPAGGGVNKYDMANWPYLTSRRFWGTEAPSYVDALNALPAGTYTITAKIRIDTLTDTSGDRTYGFLCAGVSVDGRQTIATPAVGSIVHVSNTFTLSPAQVGTFTHCYWYAGTASATSDTVTISDVGINVGNDATYYPYSNICPISGRTGLDAYVAPTSAIGDATAYSMDWTTPAGTVYAGSADVVSGDIKAAPYYASYNGETLVGPWVSSMEVYDPEGTPTTGAQVVDLGGAMTEYHITGQDIITLVGDNYIWSDSGDVTITE